MVSIANCEFPSKSSIFVAQNLMPLSNHTAFKSFSFKLARSSIFRFRCKKSRQSGLSETKIPKIGSSPWNPHHDILWDPYNAIYIGYPDTTGTTLRHRGLRYRSKQVLPFLLGHAPWMRWLALIYIYIYSILPYDFTRNIEWHYHILI